MRYYEEDFDFDRMKFDLQNYYQNGFTLGNTDAVNELNKIQNATNNDLLSLAQDSGFNLKFYMDLDK